MYKGSTLNSNKPSEFHYMSKGREKQNAKTAPYTKQGKQSWSEALFRVRVDTMAFALEH